MRHILLVTACALGLLLLMPASTLAAGFRVQANKLLFAGKPVQLRGVAMGDAVLARDGRPLSDYSVLARGWHAKLVRLDVHPGVWKHSSHESVLLDLERQVKAALANGMFVIIDWHAIGWPNGPYQQIKPGSCNPADFYDSNFALAKNFWGAVAKRFGANPRIIFELWNEPVSPSDLSDPGPRWGELKPYWQKLTDIVRAKSKNLILASSNHWTYDLRGIRADLLGDANTAYVWHIYAGTDHNDERLWAQHLDELQLVRPVFVTEWGFDSTGGRFLGSPASFGTKFARDFLEGRGLQSTAWCWSPSWGPAMLKPDWRTPNPYGAFVLEYLSKSWHR